jgi:hypothetical protein
LKQAMRALHRKLDLSTYAHDKAVAFTFRSATSADQAQLKSVHVPVPIMYRFYHLGRAYDLNQLKQLQPTGSSSVSFVPLQLLIQELEQVAQFVNDPVIQHYSNILSESFKKVRQDTSCMLHICAI